MAAGGTHRSLSGTRLTLNDQLVSADAGQRRLAEWRWRHEEPPPAPGCEAYQREFFESIDGGYPGAVAAWDEAQRREAAGKVTPLTPEDEARQRASVEMLVRAGKRINARRRLYERRRLGARAQAGRPRGQRTRERRSRSCRRTVRQSKSRGSPGDDSDTSEPGEARLLAASRLDGVGRALRGSECLHGAVGRFDALKSGAPW